MLAQAQSEASQLNLTGGVVCRNHAFLGRKPKVLTGITPGLYGEVLVNAAIHKSLCDGTIDLERGQFLALAKLR